MLQALDNQLIEACTNLTHHHIMDHTDRNHNDLEEINEWQQIEQQPSPGRMHQPSSLGLWDMVVVNENYLHVHVDQSSSTEDPLTHHHHEDSLETVSVTTIDTEGGTSSPSGTEITAEVPPPSDWRVRVVNEGKKLLKLRLGAVRNGVVWAASRVHECAVCVGAFWSVTCVAGATAAAAVLVAVFYVGIRRRRRSVGHRENVQHLVYLLREKDEKIRQLVLHIAQLNEVLSSRRKIPVLRISSN